MLSRTMETQRSNSLPYGVAWSAMFLGFARLREGDERAAVALGSEALHIARRHSYRIVEATALRLLAVSESRLSHSAAEQRFQEALLCSKSLGLGPEIAHCRFGHAISLARMDRFREAYRELSGAAILSGHLRMEFLRQPALRAPPHVAAQLPTSPPPPRSTSHP